MRPISISAFLFFIVSISTIQAQGQATTTKVDSLLTLSFDDLMNVSVVTPTLNAQMSNRVPATVKVVSREQIKIRGYRNLAEVLNDLPNVTVHDKSDPQHYNRISIRGVPRQDRFIILLDGIRISSPTNEPLPILENFPIYLAKQIEVVFGPGSALYGADAMAGVINIITDKPIGNQNIDASVTGGTDRYSNASLIYTKKLNQDVNLSIGGQYTYDAQPDFSKIYKDEYAIMSHKTGVFNTAYGPMTPTQPISPAFEAPINAYNFYGAIEKGGFNLKVLHHYISVPSSTPLSPDNAVYNKDVFFGQGVTTASSGYSVEVGKLKSITTLVASYYKVNPKSNFRNLYGNMKHGYKYSTGSMIKLEEQLHYSFSKKINIVGGLTLELFESVPKTPELESPIGKDGAVGGILLNSSSKNNPGGIEARFFPISYNNVGSYLQVQYYPISKLSFTGGVRYDNNSRFGATINPRIGSVFQVLTNTTIKALFGTAFWAPSPMVTFETYGSFYTVDEGTTYQSSYWHLPNPDLKPMTSRTFELSLEQKIKSTTISITAFGTQIDNMITDVSDNGNTNLYNNKFLGWDVDYIQVPFNKGTQKNYGGNISVSSTFKFGGVDCNIYSSLSLIEGSEMAQNDAAQEVEQGAITPIQFRVGIDAKFKSCYFSARLLNAGEQRMTTAASTDPEKRKLLDGYTVVNLSAGYTLKRNVTFFTTIQNALNEHYQNSLAFEGIDSEGSFQNPIRANVGVRATF